jgi:hemolysin activation/secretion protein
MKRLGITIFSFWALASHALTPTEINAAMQQAGSDAGAQMRQSQQNSQINPNAKRDALSQLPYPPAMVVTDQTILRASRLYFSGATQVSPDVLKAATQGYLKRALREPDIRQLLATVSDVYKQAGFEAKVYLPQQGLNSYEITLQIIEKTR